MHTHVHKSEITRRSFLRVIGWGSFLAALGIFILATVRFLFPRVLFEKPSTFNIGSLDEFKTDGSSSHKVYENWKEEHSVWIVKERARIYAVHAKCTHLGCTPNWFAEEGVFKCPCHGSQFRNNGVNFAGPAPRPLDRFSISIDKDNAIIVDKSRVYTFKEFEKPGAYLKV
jgi:cytochrome b6-f complex iron-sulfur subunit